MEQLQLRPWDLRERVIQPPVPLRKRQGWWIVGDFAFLTGLFMTVAVTLVWNFNKAAVTSLVRDAAGEHGLNPDDFLRMAEIESGLDPFAYNPVSGASGLFQLLPATARQYRLGAVFDPRANADAAAALWTDNARALGKRLGRVPSPGEIYLAHQQGATGAFNLLTNPDSLAGEVVGFDAVRRNGGTDLMKSRKFAAMWVDRFQRD